MTANNTMALTHRMRVIRRFKDVGATAPQRAIDPSTHHIRQSLVFSELIKDKVLIPIDKHHFYLDKTRETNHNRHPLSWLTVLALLLFIIALMYVLLAW